MAETNELKQMWREAFGDPKSWIDFFFEQAVSDEDIITLNSIGEQNPVAALFLRQYSANFHGVRVPVSYLCGANTRKKYRGRGYMGQLIGESLRVARERGDTLVTLIPATERLYEFYKKFGFAKAIYAAVGRYTSMHPFNTVRHYHAVHDIGHQTVAEAFCEFESAVPGRLLHTPAEYLNILEDIRLDGGDVAVVADDEGRTAGFAFGVHRSDGVVVKDVVARDDDAATGALRELRNLNPNLPFKVFTMPVKSTRTSNLVPTGMLRIVNPMPLFEVLAAENPALKCVIKLTDPLLPENDGVYRLSKGSVEKSDGGRTGSVDYNLDPGLLSLLIFASPRMGELIGFPSQRFYQALLLE